MNTKTKLTVLLKDREFKCVIREDIMAKKCTNVTIDGKTINNGKGTVYRGLGTVTGNNSSRLLMDYKVKNPKA